MHIKEAKNQVLKLFFYAQTFIIYYFFLSLRENRSKSNMGDEAGQVRFVLKGEVWGTHPTHV